MFANISSLDFIYFCFKLITGAMINFVLEENGKHLVVDATISSDRVFMVPKKKVLILNSLLL